MGWVGATSPDPSKLEEPLKNPSRLASALVLGAALLATVSQLTTTAATAAPKTPSVSTTIATNRPTIHAAAPQLTATELADWQRLTATPAGRAYVVSTMRSALAGTATVGTDPTAGIHTGSGAHTDLATGIAGDHFWIIVSYADVVSGAIWVGVRACATRLPGWLCTTAGNLLSSWAAGWGSASNHGVWAAIYWLPPHVDGGRW